jgi:ribosome biogenesis GTPase
MKEGRILKGVGGIYTVATEHEVLTCPSRGLFRNQKVSPIPGDWVTVENGVITAIAPRANELRRPRVANVGLVLVIMAVESPAFSHAFLDGLLIQAEHAGIPAAVCINKADLNPESAETLCALYTQAGYTTAAVSALHNKNISAVRAWLDGKTTVLAGPSGAGKSSFINALNPDTRLKTGEISERVARGKHTTRHAELIPLSGGYIADTPGFSVLERPCIPPIERAALFREFRLFLGQCKFSDCMHRAEDGCAVKAEVGKAIHPLRYARYVSYASEEYSPYDA